MKKLSDMLKNMKAATEDRNWETNKAYVTYMAIFDDLFSRLMEENIKLGPEGQWIIMDEIEASIRHHKQTIIDDCSSACEENKEA